MEDGYRPTDYFQHRHGDESVHALKNSCDNLVAIAEGKPGPHIEIPDCAHQPVTAVPKPGRSEPPAEPTGPSSPALPVPAQQPVYVHSADAEAFAQTEYYDELRRRSLEGRAPLRFRDSGAHPLEETMASDEFDVALY